MTQKIMLIEDEAIARKVIASTLEHAGYIVQTCENGREGLDLLLQEPKAYGLVILDWMMPVMDGMHFLQELKKQSHVSTPKVIMLTVNDAEEHMVESVEAGAVDYLTKPVEPGILLELVAHLLG